MTTALCFLMALSAWGAYFYGNSFYLYALTEQGLGSVTEISGAISVGFWMAIPASVMVGMVFDRYGRRHGAKLVAIYGALALSAGLFLLAQADTVWQIYGAYMLMGSAYPALSTPAISATLLQRVPPARYQWSLSLALTGASVGGAVAAPLLVFLSDKHGFGSALLSVAVGIAVLVIPLALLVLRPRDIAASELSTASAAAATQTLRAVISQGPFLLIFAIALISLSAQVGFLAHQISILTVSLTPDQASLTVTLTAVTAAFGRFAFAALVTRIGLRPTAMLTYATMGTGTALVGLSEQAIMMVIGSGIMGLSVGAVVMLPPLMCRAAFPPAFFGRVFGLISIAVYAGGGLGPALTGIARDLSASAQAGLFTVAGLSILAMALAARLTVDQRT